MAATTSMRSERISTMSPVSIATSVPLPMAMPTSAWASAGASFTPSPTMATMRPSPCSLATSCALFSGSTSAIYFSIPAWDAMTAAVRRLSPVNIMMSMPIPRSSLIACTDVSLRTSATPTIPATRPSTEMIMAVLPSPSSLLSPSSMPSTSTPLASISARLPINSSFPRTEARTPLPVMDSNLSAFGMVTPGPDARRTMASPRGCSDPFSAEAARRRSSSSSIPSVTTSVTSGSPRVNVPVLSNTIVSTLPAVSRAPPLLMRMPFSAPFPEPTMMAVGVARPRAQGHEITSTEMNIMREKTKRSPSTARASNRKKYQIRKEERAMMMTAGTNQAETLSAYLWIGALEACASSTRRIIWDSAVSLPTLSARTLSCPFRLMEPPITVAPAVLSTGMLSPVSMLSSTADSPSMTTPSVAIFSPGRTTKMSPTTTSSTGTSTSSPFFTTRAVLACRSTSLRMASDVRPLAFASRYFPNRIRDIIIAEVS